jgi:hypothetical protein
VHSGYNSTAPVPRNEPNLSNRKVSKKKKEEEKKKKKKKKKKKNRRRGDKEVGEET